MKTTNLLFALALLLMFSCTKDEETSNYTILGKVQKGPFVSGTTVILSELNKSLGQTGKSFSTTISSDEGDFELKNAGLSNEICLLTATGYYFNEATGKNSEGTLTLTALADLRNETSTNINVITHLSLQRILNLVENGLSFDQARKQAEQEVLEIFEIAMPDMQNSGSLDITKKGDGHAVLLAVSSIVQGATGEGTITALMADISDDIKADGKLDDPLLGSQLMTNAMVIDTNEIIDNMKDKYKELGVDIATGNFGKYVEHFIQHSGFSITSGFEYPKTSNYGENILHGDKSTFNYMSDYSMAATIPEGEKLKITLEGGLWSYRTNSNGPVNWNVSSYDFSSEFQSFTSVEGGGDSDMILKFHVKYDQELKAIPDTITIKYYENNFEIPVRTKVIVAK